MHFAPGFSPFLCLPPHSSLTGSVLILLFALQAILLPVQEPSYLILSVNTRLTERKEDGPAAQRPLEEDQAQSLSSTHRFGLVSNAPIEKSQDFTGVASKSRCMCLFFVLQCSRLQSVTDRSL